MKPSRWLSNILDAPAIPAPVKAQGGNSGGSMLLEASARRGVVTDGVDTDAAYRMAMLTSWVASDLTLLANRATSANATLKVQTGRGQDAKDIDNHPFQLLLDRPNSFMSGSFLRRYTIQWRKLRGNAYWFLGTSGPGVGDIQEILPLQANLVRPRPDLLHEGRGVFRGKRVIDYEYNIGGTIMILPGENVAHFREPNPFDLWEGMSPLTGAILAIQLDYAEKVWQRDFFKEDNAIPSTILSFPQDVSNDDFDRLRNRIKAQLAAGEKRLFTRAGDLNVTVISQTLEQMQILESRKFNRDEIDRVLLGTEWSGENNTGQARQALETALARNAIQPLIDDEAETITLSVMPYYGEEFICVAPNVVPQDKALEVQEYTIYSQDMTIDENRKARNLESWTPPKGLENLSVYADVPVRLLALVQNGTIAMEDKPEPEPVLPPNAPQGNGNAPSPDAPQVGSLADSQAPEQMADNMAGKSVAWKAEAKQFRKWLRGHADDDPGQFAAVALSEADKTAIASEVRVAPDASFRQATGMGRTGVGVDNGDRIIGWSNYP